MTRYSLTRSRKRPANSPASALPVFPSIRSALSILFRIRRAVEASSCARSSATEALYSIFADGKPLPQLGRRDGRVILVFQSIERNLIVRLLGQVRLKSLLN